MTGVVLVALVLTQSASGATLKDFLDSAATANVENRATLLQAQRADLSVQQAWLALLPSLSASAGWTKNQYGATASIPNAQTGALTEVTITPTNQLDASIRLDVPLLNVANWSRISASDATRLSTHERTRVTAQAVQLQVVQSYYAYAAAQAVHAAAARALQAAQAQADVVQARTRAGLSTELEVLRSLAEVAKNEQTLADARALALTSGQSLASISGRAVPDHVTIAEESSDRPSVEPSNIEGLPAIAAAQADLTAAQTRATAARMALVPTLSGQFTQRLSNATGFQNQFATYNLGLTLTWRLDAPSIREFALADTETASAALAIDKARQQAADTLFSAVARFEASASKLKSAQAQLEASRSAAVVTRERYALGTATQLDVINAEKDLFSADVAVISARTDRAIARATVKIANGSPIQ
jgi:outer membrane protein